MAAPRPAVRHRQRSVRVPVSVGLLGLASLLVLGSLPGAPVSTGVVLGAALVLSWAGLRIMWAEVQQSRRKGASERAALARAHRSELAQRAAEHAEHSAVMTERLAEAHLANRELEGQIFGGQGWSHTLEKPAARSGSSQERESA